MREFKPVIVSGIGGCGTKIVAQLLIELGYFMGNELNAANDNLLFTERVRSTEGLTQQTLQKFIELNGTAERFGWKEPNAHMELSCLQRSFPQMKYIHVVRNGLDHAILPKIRYQYIRWARKFNISRTGTTASKLRFWCAVNKAAISQGNLLGENFLLLRYEDLCSQPQKQIQKICNFLEVPYRDLSHLIKPSERIGIFKKTFKDRKIRLRDQDVDYVNELFQEGA